MVLSLGSLKGLNKNPPVLSHLKGESSAQLDSMVSLENKAELAKGRIGFSRV